MRAIIGKILLIIFLLSGAGIAKAMPTDQIMQAMSDEIDRTMNLQLKDLQKPYYLEYKLTITKPHALNSTLGSITEATHTKTAELTTQVRVGDYQFDNTNFFDVGLSFFGSSDDEESFKGRQIPLELDYSTLRRELWLASDAAYKQSAELLSKKEAAMKNLMRKDTTRDFIKLPPEKHIDTIAVPELDTAKYKKLCNDVSAVFKKYPDIQVSTIVMEFIPETVYYVNSEGREYIKNDLYTGFEIVAYTQADDGMPLTDMYTALGLLPDDLPSRDSLISAAENVAKRLIEHREADYLPQSYSGPILFEGQAAAEVFAQVFAPNFVTQRRAMTGNGKQDRGPYAAFQTKIGGRVLPEFMSVHAGPLKKEYENTLLAGHFTLDDQGVKPGKVKLVENGYLKNLLSDRTPTRRVRETNGHNRGGSPMLSNIFVTVLDRRSVSNDSLKARMMELCKMRELPYGLVVRKVLDRNIMYTTLMRLTNGEFPIIRNNKKLRTLALYKVYSDGREELIRGGETYGITVQSFKDIILAGKNEYAMNYLAPAVISPFISGGKQYVGASIVTPELLFEDGEIKPLDEDFPKPPLMANPVGVE